MYEIQTPGYYLFYLTSLDTQDVEAVKKKRILDGIYARIAERLIFIQEGWKAIGSEKLIQLAEDPALLPYRNDVLSTAGELRYILDASAERFAALKQPVFQFAVNLHEELTGSFSFVFHDGDQERELTEEEVRSYRQHESRVLRREAYRALRSVYNTPSHKITLANTYTNIVKHWTSDIVLRGYDHVMAPRTVSEQLDTAVVEMLLDQVQKCYIL